jgi:hypothetical protein
VWELAPDPPASGAAAAIPAPPSQKLNQSYQFLPQTNQ